MTQKHKVFTYFQVAKIHPSEGIALPWVVLETNLILVYERGDRRPVISTEIRTHHPDIESARKQQKEFEDEM